MFLYHWDHILEATDLVNKQKIIQVQEMDRKIKFLKFCEFQVYKYQLNLDLDAKFEERQCHIRYT